MEHFQTHDPILYARLMQIPDRDTLTPRKTQDYFSELCEAIINQQLSDKAAATIFARFIKLFPRGVITAKKLLTIPDANIRAVGTSWNKVRFLKSLARSVVDGSIDLSTLDAMENNAVIETLCTLHGIGPWTAEMFLMFSLGREDVFSFGDLGLRRAIQKLYRMKKKPTVFQLKRISKRWSPYRTYAARILWRSLDMKEGI